MNSKIIRKSIYAGALIGFAGYLYLNIQNTILAAIAFSIGLCLICKADLYLYTGKVGYISSTGDLLNNFIGCTNNFIGSYIFAFLTFKSVDASKMVNNLLSMSILDIYARSIACGILIYLAVYFYKAYSNKGLLKYLGCIVCVPLFILSGSIHSIATMYYMNVCIASTPYIKIQTLQQCILIMIISIIGNGVGSILMSIPLHRTEKRKKNQ